MIKIKNYNAFVKSRKCRYCERSDAISHIVTTCIY